MVYLRAAAAAALYSVSSVLAQGQSSSQAGNGVSGGIMCGEGNLCPESSPCCSQYGQCGVGAYCLGGCDIRYSNSLDSCVPAPVCQSQDYKLTSLDGITANTQFLGDASKANWVSQGTPLLTPDNSAVILTLAEDGASASGTLLSSSHYVWYGKVSATMKTSRGAGVVSAFVLFSDVQDEIDFEFVGTDLNTAQSNFYWQGVTDYENEINLTVSEGGDTFSAWHTYEVDWTPTSLTWSVDGNASRVLNKADTFNKTDNKYHYPQTPARIQLSLWPAGTTKSGQGTIDWAGGLINWNSQDVQTNGYFYSMYNDVNVECYPAPSDANGTGTVSYKYGDVDGLEGDIELTNDPTILGSFVADGTDMSKGKSNPSSTSSTKGGSATATPTNLATVPGLSGAGGTDGTGVGGDSGSGSGSSSGSDSGSGTSSASGTAATGIGGFDQGDQKQGSGASKGEEVTRGSIFAALVAFIGVLMMWA
ncbi:hypothetical protein HO173_008493 [Letharia columbiana]|uniref:GH16 domain-containing protein n=1 Tax=Letharia columbiana TaxID=112416 RepID=A0A8H6FR85_9LECA|nr:uncharacterized protein HO173_008493 [Letharia columbiana]KAF6233204.1 hypothetical protein HO173_008493 [Letharia columbiana]